MKTLSRFALLLLVLLSSGCLSTSSPDGAHRTISRWIPPGTSKEDAIRIMRQHGFESGTQMLSSGEHVIWFRRTTKFINNFCFFDVHRRDGKVLSIDRPT